MMLSGFLRSCRFPNAGPASPRISRRFRLLCLILSLGLAFSLCGCGSSQEGNSAAEGKSTDVSPDGESVVLTDMVGRNVEVAPGKYTRVVCIGAGSLRYYSYVGDMELLCGVEDIDNLSLEDRPKMFDSVARPYVLAYGDLLSALPSCGVGGPNAQSAEAEKILACNPDLVLSEYEDADRSEALQQQLGVPVITLKTGADGVFDDAFSDTLTLLGTLLGREERAAELIAYVQAQSLEISRRTADLPDTERPGVYICGLGNWGTTNHLMTAQNYAPFRIANIRNVVTDLGKDGIGSLESEKFVALGEAMDFLFLDVAAIKNIQPLLEQDPALMDSCKAWHTGQVYREMAYNAYYTNFEIALANTWYLAMTVYPDAFADVDIAAKTDEITEMFLGVPLAEAIFACPSSYGGYGPVDTSLCQ